MARDDSATGQEKNNVVEFARLYRMDGDESSRCRLRWCDEGWLHTGDVEGKENGRQMKCEVRSGEMIGYGRTGEQTDRAGTPRAAQGV
jgi:hypothetical protein